MIFPHPCPSSTPLCCPHRQHWLPPTSGLQVITLTDSHWARVLLTQCPIIPPRPNPLHGGFTKGCLFHSSSSSCQCLSALRAEHFAFPVPLTASCRHAVQSWPPGAAPFNLHGSVRGPAPLPLSTSHRARLSLLLSPPSTWIYTHQTKPLTSLRPVQHLPAQLALGTALHSTLGSGSVTDRLQARHRGIRSISRGWRGRSSRGG